jgi:thiol-activated cytolysin
MKSHVRILVQSAPIIAAITLACGCTGDIGPGAPGVGETPSTENDTAPPEEAASIDDYIRGLGTPSLPPSGKEVGDEGEPVQNDDYTCTEVNYLETKQFDKIVAFAANSHSMFPGAIIGGDSIQSGLFTPKVLPRAPITISASLEGVLDGPVSAELTEPSLSSFREAMGEILSSRITGNTAANLTFDIKEVYSEEQLSFALGLDVGWTSGEISASYSFEEEQVKSRFVASFFQTYSTVDVDGPGPPSSFFGPSVTVDDVRGEVGTEPPAYVSSVSYGRMVYFTVESEFSSEETRAALEFGLSAGTVDIDGSVSLTHSEVLEQSHITAFVLGGNGDIAVQTIDGVDALREYITTGGTYSPESPGAAIAYKLAYLADHSAARFSLSTDYTVKSCARASQNVRVTFERFEVTGPEAHSEELELYGNIDAIGADGERHNLWSRPRDNFVSVRNGDRWPQQGSVASVIVPVDPSPGGVLTIDADVWDRDDGDPDDHMLTADIPRFFEEGWRIDDWTLPFAFQTQAGYVLISLQPVP